MQYYQEVTRRQEFNSMKSLFKYLVKNKVEDEEEIRDYVLDLVYNKNLSEERLYERLLKEYENMHGKHRDMRVLSEAEEDSYKSKKMKLGMLSLERQLRIADKVFDVLDARLFPKKEDEPDAQKIFEKK